MKLGRALLVIFRPLYYVLFPYRIKGREILENRDKGPVILCSNHISVLDPVFLLMGLKKTPVYFMAKAELFKKRLSAWFIGSVFGAFPVDRGKGDTGALDTAEKLVKEGKLLGIYPEGTRSKDGRLGRMKSGAALIAARTGAAVIPVAVTAKDQRVRLFHRTRLVVGQPLSPAELHLDNPGHPDLRYASRLLGERIAALMERPS